jgi:FMN phosphatase YigB (HAD superfamily)
MIRALVFDAYGTLFDLHSVRARCDALWIYKPAPEVFQLAVDRLGFQLDEIVGGLHEVLP